MIDFVRLIEFIQLLIIGSMWIWGIFAIFDDGMILWPIRKSLEELGADWWLKPFISCPACMGSVHGFIIGFYCFGPSLNILFYMICLCGLNFIIKEYLYP